MIYSVEIAANNPVFTPNGMKVSLVKLMRSR
jgi:hypothetical protein